MLAWRTVLLGTSTKEKKMSTQDASKAFASVRKSSISSPNVPKIMKQGRLTPWLYLLPALLVMSFFIVYPMITTIGLSFSNKDGTASAATTCVPDRPCWGVFENYHQLLEILLWK
jgi:ABC-type spermidine/putrescine transport system permease subunit I